MTLFIKNDTFLLWKNKTIMSLWEIDNGLSKKKSLKYRAIEKQDSKMH